MDPEQTFIRVQERFSQMLRPRIRTALEYIYLFVAVTLFAILVVMHANYVQQPGCSTELSGVTSPDVQLIYIKITSNGLFMKNSSYPNVVGTSEQPSVIEAVENPNVENDGVTPLTDDKYWSNWINSGARRGKATSKFWKSENELLESQVKTLSDGKKTMQMELDGEPDREKSPGIFSMLEKRSFRAIAVNIYRKWHRRISFLWRHGIHLLQSIWNISGIHLDLDALKWLDVLHLDSLNLYVVHLIERKVEAFEPTYIYTKEKGYFLLPEDAKARHNIRIVNLSISARHPCFGNRWQQLLINRVVGYDTILMNSLLSSPGQGYLFNYQTKEFYNLSFAHEPSKASGSFGDYLVTKCGVLMMSLFVFFTTTMSVSFTLRETQTRMLKFTVQLQHHARHRLPTFQLIFVHVVESLVFVPIMIGILFFLFEFYDDQLLAFMVLILVWLCELFTLISVRTPISMKFFPRFFLLYFLVFHIYFFSYAYGFSYLALFTTAAFMQHLILYFWNRFEVPALQRFMQTRRSQLLQDFQITSSTFLASTVHITRVNTRNPNPGNPTLSGQVPSIGPNAPGSSNSALEVSPGIQDQLRNADRHPNHNVGGNTVPAAEDNRQPAVQTAQRPGNMNSFSSLLLWILGGASSEGLNSFFSMFRDLRDQGPFFGDNPPAEGDHEPNAAQEGSVATGER